MRAAILAATLALAGCVGAQNPIVTDAAMEEVCSGYEIVSLEADLRWGELDAEQRRQVEIIDATVARLCGLAAPTQVQAAVVASYTGRLVAILSK